MRQLAKYAALVILLASVFFIARALDDNDRWRGCEIDGGTVTCTFIEHTTRRGGETYIEGGCALPVILPNGGGYKTVCQWSARYYSHIIGGE